MSAAAGTQDIFVELCTEDAELRLTQKDQKEKKPDWGQVQTFLDRVALSGENIGDERRRRSLQAMINYWSGELITRGKVGDYWTAPALAKPAGGTDAARNAAAPETARPPTSAPASPPPPSPPSPERSSPAAATAAPLPEPGLSTARAIEIAAKGAIDTVLGTVRTRLGGGPAAPSPDDRPTEHARKLIQIAATARRWRANPDSGWLLSGSALLEAERFVQDDDDIRALVVASRDNVTKTRRLRYLAAGFGAAILIALVAIVHSYYQLELAQRRLEETIADRNALTQGLKEQIDSNERQRQEIEAAAQRQRAIDRERQAQFDTVQSALRTMADVVRQATTDGRIDASAIPSTLSPYLNEVTVSLPLLPPGITLSGYDPAFLSGDAVTKLATAIPLPRSRDGSAATEAKYLNYSLVMAGEARRMPRVAAVNIKRSALVALRRFPVAFQLDPRIPQGLQAPAQWFAGNDLDLGTLVNAREIAWGEAFPADATAAGRRADAMVSAYTNVTLQYDNFNRGVWSLVETYARQNFASAADRVTVFSGPVLAPNDPPGPNGGLIPRTFWKVMVARKPDDPTTLLVEAYLISQFGPDGAKVPQQTPFDRRTSRVSLAALENLTGLDFGEVLRTADSAATIVAVPLDLNAAIASLDRIKDPSRDVRLATMQTLLDTIRSVQVSPTEIAPLVNAIVTMAGDASFKALTPQVRVNVVTLLAAIPKSWWDRPDWLGLKATARRAAADAVATLGGCASAGDACAQLALAKERLDWGAASNRIVYLQFAGMERGDVQAMSARLAQLGWTLPGQERTPAAAKLNEVRYADTPDDRRAAELLAADYRVLTGRPLRTARNPDVKRGITELWISQ
ncbi:DNA/RNA non-specific endonuclease [Bosea sp. LjRoot237]|uniref:DNA/RNA non-specific endonuclease n=1 Tax=Bosea sp. LjRoot237 TaxID=3342292 RepID=UPI003F4FC140